MNARNDTIKILKNRKHSIIILILSAFVFLFYFSLQAIISNVYKYAFVGALFELLSIPMLVLLVTLPILCVSHIIKGKEYVSWYTAVSLVLITATIFIIIKTS
ncbi:MAG TPA: hypothetical protein VM888_11980 [Chitinophagaceae bacterium]|nr:hypothetical protein [Chitinophagaceae bacterium]